MLMSSSVNGELWKHAMSWIQWVWVCVCVCAFRKHSRHNSIRWIIAERLLLWHKLGGLSTISIRHPNSDLFDTTRTIAAVLASHYQPDSRVDDRD